MPIQKKNNQSKDTLLSVATGLSLIFVIALLGWLVITIQNAKQDRLLKENIEMELMDFQNADADVDANEADMIGQETMTYSNSTYSLEYPSVLKLVDADLTTPGSCIQIRGEHSYLAIMTADSSMEKCFPSKGEMASRITESIIVEKVKNIRGVSAEYGGGYSDDNSKADYEIEKQAMLDVLNSFASPPL